MQDEFEDFDQEFEEIEERNNRPRFSFKPNWWAIGGTVLAGIVIKQVFFKSNPKFEDTDVPDGEIDEARVVAFASELWESFENFKFEVFDRTRCNLLGRLGSENNAMLVSIANEYKNKYGKTIRQSLNDLTFRPCAFWQTNEEEHVLTRFSELNIP